MSAATDFFSAIKEGRQAEIQRLLRGKPDLIHENEAGLPPVMVAVYHNKMEIAEFLAAKAATLTVFEAAALGKTSNLARLLAKDPDLVNAFSADGFQPLGLACFFGHYEAAKYLISTGARVNTPSRNPMNVAPLHSAAASGHPAIVKLLLERGADPNARQQGDFTPLHAAAQKGDIESIRSLLFYGADQDAKSTEGKIPLAYAAESGKAGAVELLKEGITKRFRSK